MAKVPELGDISPEYLWKNLHTEQGRTAQAGELGERVLRSIDTQGFTDISVAERYDEIAAITLMTSMTAFKQSSDWTIAGPHIIRAARTAADHYPIGNSEEMAILRGNYWDPVYGKESAQRIAAGHLEKLYSLLSVLSSSDQLGGLAQGLQVVLSERTIASNEHERFDLIHVVEKPTTFFAVACAAYEEFMIRYGFESPTESVDQIITVTTKMLGRAFAERDRSLVGRCLTTLKIAVQKKPDMLKFVIKEIGKNFLPNKKDQLVDVKLRNWATAAHSSGELLELIRQLEEMVFLGLGHNDATELQSR